MQYFDVLSVASMLVSRAQVSGQLLHKTAAVYVLDLIATSQLGNVHGAILVVCRARIADIRNLYVSKLMAADNAEAKSLR